MAGVVLMVNILDRIVGVTDWFHSATELLYIFSWPFKIGLAASCYIGALYVDINRKVLFQRNSNDQTKGTASTNTTSSSNKNNNTNMRTQRMPFCSAFLPKVGWAFFKVLPAYPFLAVLISFGFLFVINIWEFLHLPEEWLNMPIYYGTLYGPFAYTYVHVKQQVACYESLTLPT
ncbi:hypothetical protein IV203_013832 [Nitzschia inconspicua]|uniref:Uncharacterized protein n=1 Tax=Nitzschia inconspicua TaxID=303405 RepID=A0A9K3M668_9STRA|nr:hypothetical protein IV203_013832 [Nitzschia inconspicua]